MTKQRLPADFKPSADRLFLEKEKWHHRRARMSFTEKIEVLDRLLLMAETLPKLEEGRSRKR
ncbi:MAG: hypothetical protein ACRD1R_20840 [Acidobacteriota bacterium]